MHCVGSAEDMHLLGLMSTPDEDWEPYWNSHMLNRKGITADVASVGNLRFLRHLLLAWHLYLSLKRKVGA